MNYFISNLGPIKEANLNLGDVTVIIGPQATGKTILLQTFKLILETEATIKTIKDGALGFWKDIKDFQEIYYGKGVRGLITAKTKFKIDNEKESKLKNKIESIKPEKVKEIDRKVYYVPSQRSLVMENGWPGNLTSFTPNYPFVVKEFSEGIRLYLEYDLKASPGTKIFPVSGLLKDQTRNMIKNDIYREGEIKVNQGTEQKIIIDTEKYNGKIPVTAWSTGQREFFPLLLFSYYILSSRGPGANLEGKYIIIEEPEMGLHPSAIYSFMFLVMDFVGRGAKVIISTHSVYILDIVWVIREMQKKLAKDQTKTEFLIKKFLDLFSVKSHNNTKDVANKSLTKNYKVYFMKPEKNKSNEGLTFSTAIDISDLNPGSDLDEISGWGGLTEKSSHAADIIVNL